MVSTIQHGAICACRNPSSTNIGSQKELKTHLQKTKDNSDNAPQIGLLRLSFCVVELQFRCLNTKMRNGLFLYRYILSSSYHITSYHYLQLVNTDKFEGKLSPP